jgi:hypothetical protein
MFFVRFVNRPVGPVFLLAMDLLPNSSGKNKQTKNFRSQATKPLSFSLTKISGYVHSVLVRSSLSTAVGVS